MTHLARQQRLVLNCVCQLRVGLLTFDRNAQEPGKHCEEICVCAIELSWIRAVYFQYAVRVCDFVPALDQHIDGAPYAVISQQSRRAKAGVLVQVV